MFQYLLFNQENGVATITLNRPDRFNAFNNELSFELIEALKKSGKDPEVRVVVLTGAGKAFCSGQDLKDIQGTKRSLGESVEKRYNPKVRLISTLEKPVICSLNGVAAGAGAGLALACDYVIAASEAYFVFSFINVGLVSDSGSSYTLPRLVGKRRAFEMLSLGEKISATEALALGMINSVVSADELEKATQEIALRYAQMPTKAVGMMKKMLNRSSHSSLDQMLELEMFYQEIAGSSADYQEGVNAFNEKRKPNFTGK